ncbi:host cell division inhibitor Icd-like protein [Escherichia coli]|uniref:host cell division inhibitor Icd-like protein n=6 Tax=Escherichia coli TaxID=562 RepID=UPI0032183359
MLCTPYKKQMQYAGKKISVQHLACLTPRLKLVFNTLLMKGAETTKPRTLGAVTGLLTTNDRKRIEVAMLNHTTHPQGRDPHNLNKYIWRFIALSTAQPRVITIGATSEQEARQQSPTGWVMVLASRFHHRCLFFVCLSSGYGVVPFQRMRGRSLMKRSSGKLSDGAGGRTRRSRLRWRTTLASVISPDSFIFIKSYLRAHLLWRFLFLMKTYSGSGVSYLKIWFNFSCLALMTARNNICRCFVFTSRTVGDNMDLFMVLTCNALRRDASYHGGGYRFVRIRPLMKSSSGKCSGRGNSGGTGLLLMRSRSLAARAAFSFCRSTSNGTPLSFMVPPVYPLLTDGYRCIFRTNYLINTSDHIIREPEYTGAIIPHLLAYAQLTADMALNEAKAILIADCEYGVMRDDRFNALKQEFDGTPEDTDIALLCVADMVKAACFLLETAEHSGTGSDILNIASDYAEYVAEARYRRKFQEVVSHE